MAHLCNLYRESCLLTAHHIQDNAETVLLNIERGSGLDGICGIAPVTMMYGMRIVRPMLHLNKVQIHRYLSERNVPWVEDPSNTITKFRRAFYRTNILPMLGDLWQQRV